MYKYIAPILFFPLIALAQTVENTFPNSPETLDFVAKTKTANTMFRLGIESIKLLDNDAMGMIGGSYLFELTPGIYVGPAVYGAITGQHGGFFTGGAEVALEVPLASRLSLVTGIYAGGGGGGSAMVGGGLMIRPHIDLNWRLDKLSAGLSFSQVRFPNGSIKSNQVGVTFSMPDDFVYTALSEVGKSYRGAKRGVLDFDRFALSLGSFQPNNGITNKANVPYSGSLGFAGFQADHFITPHFFWGVQSGATIKGGADGYMDLLGAVGAEFSVVSDRIKVGTRLAAGMGGGRFDTYGRGSFTEGWVIY